MFTERTERHSQAVMEWEPGYWPGSAAKLPRGCYPACKLAAEWVIGGVLLLVAAPLMLLIAVLVKLTSPGPVLYSQTRLGKNGRPYRILKIRTMYHDCERHTGARWATAGDPRITPLGRLLRRTHLDEFPQLWNVLRGEMSLIGPRPERPEFLPQLEQAIPRYRDRLLLRPGITGLAQVHLPPDTDIESVRRKLQYDLYYIRHLNAWLDLQLTICTALKLFGVPFWLSGRLVGVPGKTSVDGSDRELGTEETGAPQVQPDLA